MSHCSAITKVTTTFAISCWLDNISKKHSIFLQAFLLQVVSTAHTAFLLTCPHWCGMVGHFSGTKIAMLLVFMETCNTDLLFGLIVFFLAYCTDRNSLLSLSAGIGASFHI